MATLPEGREPQIAGEIVLLDPRDIDIRESERLRPVDPVWADAIGSSMARDGQVNAVHVCATPEGGWVLAGPGGHRVTGARKHGVPIEAKIVSANRDVQRRWEAVENLFRRSNDPLERAEAVAELVRLHKLRAGIDPAKDGRTASAQTRWQKQVKSEADDANVTMTFAYGWSADVAEQLGLSKSTIERDLLLYRRLPPSLVARLRDARHPVATNAGQLRALAKLDDDLQAQVVDRMIGENASLADVFSGSPRPKTVSAALAAIRGSNAAQDPEAKRLSAFIGAFSRMSIAEKKGALAELAGLLPAGFQIIEGED